MILTSILGFFDCEPLLQFSDSPKKDNGAFQLLDILKEIRTKEFLKRQGKLGHINTMTKDMSIQKDINTSNVSLQSGYNFFYPSLNQVMDKNRLVNEFTRLLSTQKEFEINVFAKDLQDFLIQVLKDTQELERIIQTHYNSNNTKFGFPKSLLVKLEQISGKRKVEITFDLLNQLEYLIIRRDNFFFTVNHFYGKKKSFLTFPKISPWIYKLRESNRLFKEKLYKRK
jgi:hypothetical protein